MNLGLSKHKHIALKLQDLRYLDNIMYIIVKLKRYNNAQSDVLTYAMSATASKDYIEPLPTYSRNILYPQLYEEVKNLALM
jgi:RNase adaptor protein for sRNA GlmZ degradation